jgi:imidazole glycerol-phosphate synthase subunit HisF
LEKKLNFIRIIPSLLLSNKKLVKGKKFINHINAGYPSSTCLALEGQKCDEIFIIDLDSYKNDKDPDFDSLSEISKNISTPITFGGGIKNIEQAKKAFRCGADKIYLSQILFKDKEIINKIRNIYGSQSIVAGINIITDDQKLYLLEDGKKNIDILDHIKSLIGCGVGEIKVTFVNNEGSENGMNLELAKKIISNTDLPIIFEGGLGNIEQIIDMIKIGANSFAIGSMITFKDYNIFKIKQHLFNKGYKVRF